MRLWKRHPWSKTENIPRGPSSPKSSHLDDRYCMSDQRMNGLSEEFERVGRSGEDFVLIFLDLDEFQQLNGAHGRRKGDAALVLVARTLLSNTRQKDMAAHYRDDEFIVLMPGAALVEARRFFEKVRAEVMERSRSKLGFEVRMSAGAVKCLNGPGDLQVCLETAYDAMYVAKRQGKDRLFVTVDVGSAEVERNVRLEA